VAVCKDGTVVGHVPRTLSAACFSFLSMEGSICCKVTGPREYSRDLPQGGLHIPCILEFRGNKANVENVKVTIHKQREYRKRMGLFSCAEDVTGDDSDTLQATLIINSDTNDSTGVQDTALATCSSADTPQATSINNDADLSIGVQDTTLAVCSSTDTHQAPPINNNDADLIIGTVLATCSSATEVKIIATQEGGVTGPVLPNASSSRYIAVEHNYCKSELPRVWVRHGRSFLTTAERDIINYGKQLNDKHINYAQAVIQSQFSIKGMQLTLYQHTRKPSENELQIVHARGNHWITASTIFASPGCINVYDSLYDEVDSASRKVILDLFGDGNSHINMTRVQKQHGTNDCGLFAIAFAVSLARRVDPVNSCSFFEQSRMRSHLINCLQEAKFSPFPTKFIKQ